MALLKRSFSVLHNIRSFSRAFSNIQDCYWQQVKNGIIQESEDQLRAINILQKLQTDLETHNFSNVEERDEIAQIPKYIYTSEAETGLTFSVPIRSVYMFGPVGSGKTFLLDLAYENCPVVEKKRMHFAVFMKQVHQTLHLWQNETETDLGHDVLRRLAKELSTDIKVLFLDELQITDPANMAVILRLFTFMFQYGTIVVTTSNRDPQDLFKGGMVEHLAKNLQSLIYQCCDVHQFEKQNDFRENSKLEEGDQYKPCFLHPVTVENKQILNNIWNEACKIESPQNIIIKVQGRNVAAKNVANGVARFTFDDVCASLLGPNDYLAFANHFHTIIVDDIPPLTWNTREEARRLIWLIDAAYERKCQFWATSEKSTNELFIGQKYDDSDLDIMHLEMMADILAEVKDGRETKSLHLFTCEEEVFAFHRCISRLYEMGTQAYRNMSHSPLEEDIVKIPSSTVPERPEGFKTLAEKMWAPRELPVIPEEHFTEQWGSKPGTAREMRERRQQENM